ncbi:MAG: DUF4340 domain-containing protein [Nitrospirota bacterium]
MKTKGISISIAIIIILSVIYIIQQNSGIKKSETAGYIRLMSEKFKPSEVKKIEFYGRNNREKGVILKRDDGADDKWRVATLFESKANKGKIKKFLDDIKLMEGDLRASKPEVFSDFLISDEKAINIILYKDKDAVYKHLLLGKKGPGFGGNFVRFKENNSVFLIDKDLRSSIGIFGDDNEDNPDQKRWLDLEILSLTRDNISNIVLKKKRGKEYILEKREKEVQKEKKTDQEQTKEYEWYKKISGSEKTVEKSKINPLLSLISRVHAIDVTDPTDLDSYGLNDPVYTLTITIEDGKKYQIFIGKQKEEAKGGGYYLKQSEDKTVYILAKSTYDNILKKIEEL